MVAVLKKDVFMKYLEDCSKILQCPEEDCFANFADTARGIFNAFPFDVPVLISDII